MTPSFRSSYRSVTIRGGTRYTTDKSADQIVSHAKGIITFLIVVVQETLSNVFLGSRTCVVT